MARTKTTSEHDGRCRRGGDGKPLVEGERKALSEIAAIFAMAYLRLRAHERAEAVGAQNSRNLSAQLPGSSPPDAASCERVDGPAVNAAESEFASESESEAIW